MEHIHYNEAGTSMTYELHCHPIFDDNQNVIRIIEFAFDITERKKTEKSLMESKEQLNEFNQLFDNVFNTTDTCIAYLDQQFNFIWVNRAYAWADDRDPESFLGLNHFDLYPNKENEEIFKRVVLPEPSGPKKHMTGIRAPAHVDRSGTESRIVSGQLLSASLPQSGMKRNSGRSCSTHILVTYFTISL